MINLKNLYNKNGYYFPINALSANHADNSAERLENIYLDPLTHHMKTNTYFQNMLIVFYQIQF